jgi:predicted metal-dependent phosphoesterase TrpH
VNLKADLHLHTTASDGQLTPGELVAFACSARLDIIAITDHDTTDGIAEAQAAANGALNVLPGIELSAEEDGLDVHMLGYLIDVEDAAFQARLAAFRDDRVFRARRIVDKLAELKVPIAWERVQAIAGEGSIGRPHIARAMIEAGHVPTIADAFDRYLRTGGPAYVSRQRLSPEEAVDMIHRAGGVAVMAHPGLVRDYLAIIDRLVPAGLDGMEIYHPKNTMNIRDNLRGLAARYSLIVTGGSDFHRKESDAIGSQAVPPDAVNKLRERARRYARPG